MIDIAITTIDSSIMKAFFMGFYIHEKEREVKIANTRLHIFIDNRKYDFDKLKNDIESYRLDLCSNLEVYYYTNLHSYLINYFNYDKVNEKTLNYINYQTHHIKMSVPLILHDKKIDTFFFSDDDVILLKSPEKYFSEKYKEYTSVMVKDCFTRYYADSEKSMEEWHAFRQNIEQPANITIPEFNRIGIKSVGQFLFRYSDDYPIFLNKFYTNEWILDRFLTKVYDSENHVFRSKARQHASFLDEQKALSFYLNEKPMIKFERGDVVIFYDKPEYFEKRGKHLKDWNKNMLLHYGTSNKAYYVKFFCEKYKKN